MLVEVCSASVKDVAWQGRQGQGQQGQGQELRGWRLPWGRVGVGSEGKLPKGGGTLIVLARIGIAGTDW